MKQARDPARLRALAAERDLSYRELANLAGCSHQTINNAVSGKPVGDEFARAITRALRGVSTDVLFADVAATTEPLPVQQRAVS